LRLCVSRGGGLIPIPSRVGRRRKRGLFADDLDQHALFAHAIELAVEDLFPWTEVEPAVSDCDDYFASHYLALDMRTRIVFAGVVVPVLLINAERLMALLFLLVRSAVVGAWQRHAFPIFCPLERRICRAVQYGAIDIETRTMTWAIP
jgi:hypothetical protein